MKKDISTLIEDWNYAKNAASVAYYHLFEEFQPFLPSDCIEVTSMYITDEFDNIENESIVVAYKNANHDECVMELPYADVKMLHEQFM